MSSSRSSNSYQQKPLKASQLLTNMLEMQKMLQIIMNNSNKQTGENSSGTQQSSSGSNSSVSSSISGSSENDPVNPILSVGELRTLVPPNLYDQLCLCNDLTQVQTTC